MPTYAYRCSACAHEFEAVQKMSDDPLTTCPECGAPIKRVIFPAGIVFKGDGWYITESRKAKETKATASPASDGAADKATATATDTKDSPSAPAKATEPAPAKAAAD